MGTQTFSVPDLFGALEDQIGLRLDKKKKSQQVLVFDRAEKTPTAN